MTEARFQSVRKQLKAYGESWKKNHLEAIQGRELEDFLAVGVCMYHLIKNREQSWAARVYDGEIEYDPEEEQELATLYRGWMETANETLDVLTAFERKSFRVAGSDTFRHCCEDVQRKMSRYQKEQEAWQEVSRQTPDNATLMAMAAKSPPPKEWFQLDEDKPF